MATRPAKGNDDHNKVNRISKQHETANPAKGWGRALKDTLQSPFSGGMGTGKEMKLLQFGLIFRGLFQMSLVNSGCVFLFSGHKREVGSLERSRGVMKYGGENWNEHRRRN
ncbi:hypothetical protein CEXT_577211 [Caerostris extrusa]|uniref:Uncharacterized protein n=1 Tax=Caerostris extrusa TaxID=172846 RepID=A0AAV4N5Y3_CAEEX|nr:hypothetical protein CEXT_577211 [Caerostris extrusa]